VGDHLRLWTWAEKYVSLEHNLSFLLGNFAWMNRDVVNGGLFAASWDAFEG